MLACELAIRGAVAATSTAHAEEDVVVELPDRVDPYILGSTTEKDIRRALGQADRREKNKNGTTLFYPNFESFSAKDSRGVRSGSTA